MGLHTFIGQYHYLVLSILRHVVKVYWFSCFAFILLLFVFVRVHHKRKSPRDLPKSLGDSYYLFNNQRLLNCCRNPLIYKAANTKEENPCHANSQRKLSVTVTLEGW